MTHIENSSCYKADEGNFIIEIATGRTMGEAIDLGVNDTIDNYKEEPYTPESYKAYYESIGMWDEEEGLNQ